MQRFSFKKIQLKSRLQNACRFVQFMKCVFSGNISVIDWEFSQTNFAASDGAMLFGAVLYLGLVGTYLTAAWWRHQMETVSALLAICAGNSPVPGEFPHKGQWRGALMFSLIWARINGWVNNPEAGDLRRHPNHCDVIVMGRREKVTAVTLCNIPTMFLFRATRSDFT